ncbi:CPBP family intramembrane metalloprotease [Nodosilinea sp. LEGE 07088]|uniref:CPBP family intramembrane glutamic endopeptidase n=1 Tax=Nodosilinea sp. LEGE 07088 TaxID=2777968 RepID=UPI00188003BB|nr:CPBP family intramembrane glutamic endopeptidase [Nodosilinea sp. LEGE 07088]MBE9137925.1 CPBP family intramembrane metalloprotease [Nodosilinea sp. LEGE 07088]
MLHRYPLTAFFLLAYAISWVLWLPLLLSAQGLIAVQPPQILHLLGSLGPALAALMVTKICGGQVGWRDLWRRMFNWRVHWVWHAIAWLSPIALFLTAGLLTGWEGQPWQNFGRSSEYPDLPVGGYWVASIVFYGWGEETGWRGFALPHLQTRQTALTATIKLSLFWALWHLPLFGFTSGLAQLGVAEILGWYLSLLTGAILFTWLTNSTQGSILIAAVFHGTMDIAFVSPMPTMTTSMLGALITIWGIVVLFTTRPRYLSRVGKIVIAPATNTVAVDD